jgi:hypothetical protein
LTRKLSDLPLYPLLLAAGFPLDLMTQTMSMTDIHAVVRPTVICILAALAITALFWVLLRNLHRAGLCAALVILLVCYFKRLDSVFDAITSLTGLVSPSLYILAILCIAAVAIGLFARPGPNATRIGNAVAAVMLAVPVATLVAQEAAADDAAAGSMAEARRQLLFGAAQPAGTPPNIVHVVLDGYSRGDVLARYYDFDNSPFLDDLRRLGFAIADRATTPYNQTMLVMTSMLSADYLDALVPPGSTAPLRRTLRTELQRNPVMETLSRLGYRTAAFDVRYDPVRMVQADRLLAPYLLSNFEMTLAEKTLLYNVARRVGLVEPSVTRDVFTTEGVRELPAPFFLYLHVLAPHPPFDVNRHGDAVRPQGGGGLRDGSHFTQGDPQLRRIYRDGYIEKLLFTNEMVLSYLDRIMAQVPDPKLILIHGDHGGGLHFDQSSLDRTCVAERFSPLLAVYASDGRLQRDLPPDLNLANLYRLVFNDYFGTDLPLLPSRSVFADWDEPAQQQVLPPERLDRRCAPSAEVLETVQGPDMD